MCKLTSAARQERRNTSIYNKVGKVNCKPELIKGNIRRWIRNQNLEPELKIGSAN